MDKRFTTVELPKPTQWGIWYDGAYLSTYQVCILLNEYVDVRNENEQLKFEIEGMKELLKSYRKTIKHDAELLADATKNGYLPPSETWKEVEE